MFDYSRIIQRYIRFIYAGRFDRFSYIKYIQGHKNSQNESAPWCIVSEDGSRILSSHETKQEAKSHLKDIEIHKKINKYAFFSEDRRKEIIVWIWQHGNKGKDEIKDIIMKRFNISDQESERLFYEAYPDGINDQEEEILNYLNTVLSRTVNLQPRLLIKLLDGFSGYTPEDLSLKSIINPAVYNQTRIVINSLLQNRKL